MAKGFKHGAGGGTSLNFKIIGNPQPETAKENTIWLDTDVEITSWDFSATEPENPAEGMVWIIIGTSSGVAFNALKKNGIQVYPLSAKQYVGGAWVDVTAKSYQNGAWVDWVVYLYKLGDEYEDITGGWESFIGYDGSYSLGKYTETTEGITLQLNGTQKCVSTAPVNAIDLTAVSKIIVNITNINDKGGLYITTVRSKESTSNAVASLSSLVVGENELDVSALSGNYYVMLSIVSYASSTAKLTFNEVRYK